MSLWLESLKTINFIFSPVIFATVVLAVYYGPKNTFRVYGALSLFMIFLWSSTFALINIIPLATVAKSSFLYSIMFTPFFSILAHLLADIRVSRLKQFVLIVPPLVVGSIVVFSNNFLRDFAVVNGLIEGQDRGPIFYLYVIFLYPWIGITVYSFIKSLLVCKPANKKLLIIMELGIFATITLAVITNMALPSLAIYDYQVFGPIDTLPAAAAITYAVIRNSSYSFEENKEIKLVD